MNSLFGVSGISFTIMIIIMSIIANIVIVSLFSILAKGLWAKKGNSGSIGPDGEIGSYGEDGVRGIQGIKGTIKGIIGSRGLSGSEGKIPDGKICKPFSRAKYNRQEHPCKDSVLRGWSQIDWFENQDEYPNHVGCVPSRLTNKGKSSVATFFGGPGKPTFASPGDCSSGTCFVGNDASAVGQWITDKELPPNVRLQPGNEEERRSGLCIAGNSQMVSHNASLIDVEESTTQIDEDTGMPIDNSGADMTGQQTDNVLSASDTQGRMHDLGTDPGMGYVRGNDSDDSVVVGTVIENFANKPSFGGSLGSPVTQKEPTECTSFKLQKLWGIPENKIGSTGFLCSLNSDCADGYDCIGNQCKQQCHPDAKQQGSSITRDSKGRCLCNNNSHCAPFDSDNKGSGKCLFNKQWISGGSCQDAGSQNYWKCSKVGDKCGPIGTKWSQFNDDEQWNNSVNSTFTCLNSVNSEKGCNDPPCWHKIRNIDEGGIGAKNTIINSEGNISENQGLWVSNKNWDNYPSNGPYDNDGALIPCGKNPNNKISRCQSDETTDWIDGTSNVYRDWAGYVTGKALNTGGSITDYMKDGTRDILVADPVSIKDARENQCTDWTAYYSRRRSDLSGKDKLEEIIGGTRDINEYVPGKHSLQPFYPGLCKPTACIGQHRIIRPVGQIVSPKSPADSRGLVLRHKTFKTKYPTYSRPADKSTAIFNTCRCPIGYFSPNGKLNSDCKECPPGTYLSENMSDMGFTYCLDCPPGSYQDEPGQGRCKPCPGGTYQDEWGRVACKGCKCGFKCPQQTSNYDGSIQLPSGSQSLNITDVNWEIGSRYPIPCTSGEYCPGNKHRIVDGKTESRPRFEKDAKPTSDKYNAIDPHYYPELDTTQFSCLGCNDEVSASSDYCKTKGNCAVCPCPRGHFCPDNNKSTDVGGTGNTCDCPDGHSYSLDSLEKQKSLILIGENGISKSKVLKGAGQEVRCCAEGQCCDTSLISKFDNTPACKGSGRRQHGFAWPVSSPIGYQSHCRLDGMGTDTSATPPISDLQPTPGVCPADIYQCPNSSITVSRNVDDNCNFNPCPVVDTSGIVASTSPAPTDSASFATTV